MDELINNNQLIICETKKRRTPYIGCLALLTAKDKELKKCRVLETKLQQETTPTMGLSCRKVEAEMSWSRGGEEEKENEAVKEQIKLKVRQRRLEDELINKKQLIMSKTKEKKTRTNAYFGFVLTSKEKELEKSRAETLEVKLQQKMTPTERPSCRKVEAVNKENTSHNVQVHGLKNEQRKLEEELRYKVVLMKSEAMKKEASTKSSLSILGELR